jgi:hypothetical protein
MKSVVEQDINGWEAYFVGDCCPDFQKLIDDGAFDEMIAQAEANGNKIYAYNIEQHHGGWGYEIRNQIFKKANSDYTIFMDNDDVIASNHFRNYWESIYGTENDFMYFDTFIIPYKHKRDAQLMFGHIGHHEIIVKTEVIKKLPPQLNHYGHDWTLIENMVRMGLKHEKGVNKPQTYMVMALGEFREDNID